MACVVRTRTHKFVSLGQWQRGINGVGNKKKRGGIGNSQNIIHLFLHGLVARLGLDR